MLRPRVTRYLPIVDLGAVLPMRASGCVGCRRRENILGLLGFKIAAEIKALERLLSMKACLKRLFHFRVFERKRLCLERVLERLT